MEEISSSQTRSGRSAVWTKWTWNEPGSLSLRVALSGLTAAAIASAVGTNHWTLTLCLGAFEAATVGALADKYAVTALYKKVEVPLLQKKVRLPLLTYHSDIVRKKLPDMIDDLATKIAYEWVTNDVIQKLLQSHLPSRWLLDNYATPDGRHTLNVQIRRLLIAASDELAKPALAASVGSVMSEQLGRLDLRTILSNQLAGAIRAGQHKPLVRALTDAAKSAMSESAGRALIASSLQAGVERVAPQIIQWIADSKSGVPLRAWMEEVLESFRRDRWVVGTVAGWFVKPDELAERLVAFLREHQSDLTRHLCAAVQSDEVVTELVIQANRFIDPLANTSSPLGERLDELLLRLAADLSLSDSPANALLDHFRRQIVADPRMGTLVSDGLASLRDRIRDELSDDGSRLAKHVDDVVARRVQAVANDRSLQQRIDRVVTDQVCKFASLSRDTLRNVIAKTLHAKEGDFLRQVEARSHVPLQGIRLNGAVVGFTIGLAIATVRILWPHVQAGLGR